MEPKIPGKKSQATMSRNSSAIISGHQAGLYGVCLYGGKGAMLQDIDGNEYIDFLSGASVVNLGYANTEIIDIYKKQALQIHHACYPYSPSSSAIKFAEDLLKTFPDKKSKKKVLFGLSGTQVNHAALMCARSFTGKKKIVAFKNSWHGSYGLSKDATNFAGRGEILSDNEEVVYLDFPRNQELCVRALEQAKRIFAAKDVSAIILECVQGDGGNIVPVPGALEKIVKLAKKSGAVVIVDEVQSGNGRSGRYWEVEHFKFIPDLITTAKGLTSGYYPLAVVVGSAKVLESLPRLAHLNTSTANPVACEIASFVLNKINKSHFLKHINTVAKRLRHGLDELVKKYSVFKEVRGLGLHLGLEVNTSKDFDAALFGFLCLREGLFLGYFGLNKEVLRVHPPLIIEQKEIDKALQIIEKCAKKVVSKQIEKEILEAYKIFGVGLSGK